MHAVVLVGGEGTRLRPLTYSAPKQMQPVALLPMIERVADQVIAGGATDIVFSLGYKPEVFVDAFPDGKWRGVPIHFAIEPPTLLDTAGAIAFAARSAGITDTFIAVNGDVLTDIDIKSLIQFHGSKGAEGTIALTPVEDPSAFGVVVTDDSGCVESFIEKPPAGTSPTNYINAGVYVLEPSVLDLVPEGSRVSIERETFPALAAKSALYAVPCDDYWLDTGTAEKYLEANLDYLNGNRGDLEVEDGWTVVDVDGSNTSLFDVGVSSEGMVSSSVLGKNVVIEPGASVSSSVIFDDVTIETGCEITDSIIGTGAHVGSGAKISEASIIGYGAKVEANAIVVTGRIPE